MMQRRGLLLAGIAVLLAGCGRKGNPAPPPGASGYIYPRVYPNPETVVPPGPALPDVPDEGEVESPSQIEGDPAL